MVETTTSYLNSSVYRELMSRKVFSPDIRELENNALPTYVFIYGKHEIGKILFPLCLEKTPGVQYLGRGLSCLNTFQMKRTYGNTSSTDRGVVFKTPNAAGSVVGKVIGDLFAVPPSVILHLDRMYKNNVEYTREKHWMVALEQEIEREEQEKMTILKGKLRPFVNANIYIGIPEYWSTVKSALHFCPKVKYKDHSFFSWDNPT